MATPLRVVKLSSYMPGIGGGELQTHAIGRAMRRIGIQVRVVDTRGEGGPACSRLDGIPVLRYRTPGIPLVDVAVQQARLTALLARLRGRCDVLQVNHLSSALLPALAAGRRHGIPVILLLWGSCRPGVGPFRTGPHRAFLRACGRRADRILALSHSMAESLVSRWGFPAQRMEVIPNGVDTGRFHPRPGTARPPGLPQGDGPVAITVGRLAPAKRHDLLLTAWAEVAARVPGAHLAILGQGDLLPALRAQAARLGIQERVTFPGAVGDVEAWLAAAQVYVSSSDNEGMSNAVLEAMASGLPVVATQVSGSLDLVEDGAQGLLVPPGQPGPLVEALTTLLAAPERRAALGRAARQRIEASYSLEAVARRYRACYASLLAGPRPAAGSAGGRP